MLYYFSDHGLPFSLIFFAIALFLFLLQSFPYTGIFLMMVAGPLWTALLINAGFVGLGVEALAGRAAPGWLLAPLLWFGGYAGVRALEWRQIAAERKRLEAINARLALPFDPAHQDILVQAAPGGSGGGGGLASPLLQQHDIARVYSKGDWTGAGARVHRLLELKTVNDLVQGYDLVTAGISSRPVPKSGGRHWQTSGSLKEIVYPQEPSRPVVQLTILPQEKAKRGTLPIVCTPVDIEMPGAPAQRLVTGTASPLRLLPMLVAGGALDSGTPAWRLFVGFLRSKPVPLVEGTEGYGAVHLTIGRVLGLARLAPEDHPPSDPGQARRQVETVTADKIEAELDKLRAMIADPETRHKDAPFGLLRRRPALVAEFAEAMLGAMEIAYAAEARWGETGRVLASLLARAPEETLQALKPRLLAFYAPPLGDGDKDDWRAKTEQLLARLGEFGTDALPIVVQGGFRQRRGKAAAHDWALQAICRLGAPARAAAGARVLAIWNERPRDPDPIREDMFFWAYLALLRMGMKAEAGPVKQFYRGSWFERAYADITPDSPAEQCAIR
jgi:hypothetical protein